MASTRIVVAADRPTFYTSAVVSRICEQLGKGRGLADICKQAGMPSHRTVRRWFRDNRHGVATLSKGVRAEQGQTPRQRSIYKPEIANRICRELAEGRILYKICEAPGMPDQMTIMTWVLRNRYGFAARYRTARRLGHQKWIGEIFEIAGTAGSGNPGEHIERTRLRIEAQMWLLELLPRICSARVDPKATRKIRDRLRALLEQIEARSRSSS